jgi:hypothetical protein
MERLLVEQHNNVDGTLTVDAGRCRYRRYSGLANLSAHRLP